MLSLESVLGFCHGIAKGGDCKVEFIQPSNWLYSVPNLLVIQHLVTLYLGGIVVRVVSEIVWRLLKSVQENRVSRLGLAGGLAASTRQKMHTCQACWKMNSHASWSTTGQNRTTGHTVNSRLSQAARSSREPPLFWKNLTFRIPLHSSINTLLTHDWKRASRENFERETLKKKQDCFTHNPYLRVSSYSSTLFLSIVKSLRGILPNLVLTIIITVRQLFGVLGSS